MRKGETAGCEYVTIVSEHAPSALRPINQSIHTFTVKVHCTLAVDHAALHHMKNSHNIFPQRK